jgi:small GTP-binding protein
VDFKIRREQFGGTIVKLQMWDTAGLERFRVITSSYLRGATAYVVVYDVTNKKSFEETAMWMAEIERHASPESLKLSRRILIGNKCDAPPEDRVIYT